MKSQICFSLSVAAKSLMWMPIFLSFQPKFQLFISVWVLPAFCLCTHWFNMVFTWYPQLSLQIQLLEMSLHFTNFFWFQWTHLPPLCKFAFSFLLVYQFINLRCQVGCKFGCQKFFQYIYELITVFVKLIKMSDLQVSVLRI